VSFFKDAQEFDFERQYQADECNECEYKYEWTEALPRWAYLDREWEKLIKNPDNSMILVKVKVEDERRFCS